MIALLQPGLTRASLHDYRLGHILDALCAANLNTVFSAVALKALAVYAMPTPGCIRTPRRLSFMGRMQMNRRQRGGPGRPMDTAKTVVMLSNRCS